MPPGRQSEFTQEIADRICERLADGESLLSVCRDPNMPAKITVLKWLSRNEDFAAQYAHARVLQAEVRAEEILAIADDGSNDTYEDEDGNVRVNNDVVQRSKLRVDSRRWLMAKMAPKKYGDRLELTGSIEHRYANMTDEELDALIGEKLAALGVR